MKSSWDPKPQPSPNHTRKWSQAKSRCEVAVAKKHAHNLTRPQALMAAFAAATSCTPRRRMVSSSNNACRHWLLLPQSQQIWRLATGLSLNWGSPTTGRLVLVSLQPQTGTLRHTTLLRGVNKQMMKDYPAALVPARVNFFAINPYLSVQLDCETWLQLADLTRQGPRLEPRSYQAHR